MEADYRRDSWQSITSGPSRNLGEIPKWKREEASGDPLALLTGDETWWSVDAAGALRSSTGAVLFQAGHPLTSHPVHLGQRIWLPGETHVTEVEHLTNGTFQEWPGVQSHICCDGATRLAGVSERGMLLGEVQSAGCSWSVQALPSPITGCCWWRNDLWMADDSGQLWQLLDGRPVLRHSLGALYGGTLQARGDHLLVLGRSGQLFFWSDAHVQVVQLPLSSAPTAVVANSGLVLVCSLEGVSWAQLDSGETGRLDVSEPVSAPAWMGNGSALLVTYDGVVYGLQGKRRPEVGWVSPLPTTVSGFVLAPVVLPEGITVVGPDAVYRSF